MYGEKHHALKEISALGFSFSSAERLRKALRKYLLEVASKIVDRRERELVLVSIAELLVVYHKLVLILELVRYVEEDSVLEGAFGSVLGCFFGLRFQCVGRRAGRQVMQVDTLRICSVSIRSE